MKRIRIIDTLGLRPPRLVEARSIVELPNGTMVRTAAGARLMLPGWDFRARGPRYLIREAGDDAPAAQQQQEQKQRDPGASLDARVNSYIDDLLEGEFDATRFAEQLQALAKRAGNVLALEKTVLQMGIQRVPDDKRDQVKRALGEKFGISPDKSDYDEEADVQAPRAGRAGPSS
jgi:hypothetical protein